MNRQKIKKANGETVDVLTEKESAFVSGVKKKLARGKNLSSDVLRETTAEVYGKDQAEKGHAKIVLSRPAVQRALELDGPEAKEEFTGVFWQNLRGSNPMLQDPDGRKEAHLCAFKLGARVFLPEKTEARVTNTSSELSGLSTEEKKVYAMTGKIPAPGLSKEEYEAIITDYEEMHFAERLAKHEEITSAKKLSN